MYKVIGFLAVSVLLTVLMIPAFAADTTASTDKPFIDSGEGFRFAIISDNQSGPRPGVLPDAVEKLNRLRPEFVMSVGDYIDGYTEDTAQIEAEWEEFFAIVAPFDMRLFLVAGNHEVTNATTKRYYEEKIGPLYYHFVHKNVLFLCVNSQDGEYVDWNYPTAVSDKQADYIRKALEENPDVRWTFVFMHQPLWDREWEGYGWEKIAPLLVGRPHTVFGGHLHSYALYDVDGNKYVRLATTGGESELAGKEAGSLDHVTWVAMTPEGPVISNLALDGMLADDFSTEVTQRVYEVARWETPVTGGSFVTEEKLIKRLPIRVSMVNDTDVEMTASAVVTAPRALVAASPELTAVVAPRSRHEGEVVLEAAEPLAVNEVPTVTIDWEAAFPLPGRETVTAEGSRQLMIEGLYDVARPDSPVTVDGLLDDWAQLPVRMERPAEIVYGHNKPWNGLTDASLAFGVAQDGENLYIGVAVVDDVYFADVDRPVHQCDAVTILVDPRPRAERAEPSEGWSDYFVAKLNPGEVAGQERFADEMPLAEGMAAVSLVTDAGHNTEVAIPLSAIAAAQGGDVKDIRVNIRLHDRDDGDDASGHNYLWWRPDWHGTANFVDSGTFLFE